MSEKTIVVSDLHLGKGDGFDIFDAPGKGALFSGFLSFARSSASSLELVINGDFVDFLQLKPWDGVNRKEAKSKIAEIVAAHPDVFQALASFLTDPSNKLTVLLGNHDVELGYSEIWKVVSDALLVGNAGAADRLNFTFASSLVTYPKRVGGVLVHIEHGNWDDPYNSLSYHDLYQDNMTNTSNFHSPPGTQFVYDVMNKFKETYRFVDLLKPEVPSVPLLLLTLDPLAVRRLPAAAWNAIQAMRNGFLTRLRTLLGGRPLGAKIAENLTDEEKAADDMALAYAAGLSAGVTNSELLLVEEYFEQGAEEGAAEARTLGPKLKAIERRMARAAIAILGRPDDLHDRSYYSADHPGRPDAKWARKRMEGDVKVVIFGHTHRPLKTEFEDGRVYVNSGAWANQIPLPSASDDALAWMEGIRSNSFARMSFPTYVTLTPQSAGLAVSLNLWSSVEETLWSKNISA